MFYAAILLSNKDDRQGTLHRPELNFVRALEIYSNMMHEMDEAADKLQVFFLLNESSAEESSFLH